MVYQLTEPPLQTSDLRATDTIYARRVSGVKPVGSFPNVGAHLPGEPLPSGHARDTGNWPSGWWILPSVLGGLVAWIMIFRALLGWLL
jgi:hypothetical protein